METKIIKKEMENSQKKNKIAINFAKGGSIGIILVGGALLVNAFHKKKKPPTNKNHKSPNSSPFILQHLISKKESESGDSKKISHQTVFPDGNHKFEGSIDENEDLKFEDEEISKDSEDQTMVDNGFVIETEKLSNSVIHQPTVSNTGEDINGIAVSDAIVTTTEVDRLKIEELGESCCINSHETGEENSGSIDDCDQKCDKNGEDDDVMLHIESIEDSKINEIPEATDDSKSNAEEKNGNNSVGSLDIIKEEEINGSFEADKEDEVLITSSIQTREGTESKGKNQPETPFPEDKTVGGENDFQDTNNGLLTTGDNEVSEKIELLEEPLTKLQLQTVEFEEKENEFDALTNSTAEAIEEEETQHDVQTKAAEIESSSKQSIDFQVIQPEAPRTEEEEEEEEEEESQNDIQCIAAREVNEDKETQNSALINAEVGVIENKEEEEKAQLDDLINAAEINPGTKLIEFPTILDQDYTYLSHQITSDDILPEENDQNISFSTIPLTLDHESEELSQDHLATSIIGENIENENIEEGSVHQEPNLVKDHQKDKIQENGEHVNPQETEKEIHYDETVNTEKGISNMNFLKKYMVMKLAEQKNDEKMSLLMKQRGPIVIGTMSALLSPLFYSYFGLPFLHIFLIVFLLMILSKIHL